MRRDGVTAGAALLGTPKAPFLAPAHAREQNYA
jgi:hypothetical protein